MKNILNGMNSKKLLVTATIGIIAIFIVIVVVLLLITTLTGNNRSYSYAESKMLEAAKNYYQDNSKRLPVDVNTQVTITAAQLAEDEYMDDLNKITPESDKCTGKVIVTKSKSGYNYTSYLDCGKNYKTSKLSEYIISNVNTVADGVGLYQMNGEYVYRGETPKNYITFAKQTWRIVKIDRSGRLVLLLETPVEKSTWDDRYNTERSEEVGINDYNVSRIYETLNRIYNTKDYFNDKDKLKLASFDACIGKRGSTVSVNDSSVECTNVLQNQTISAIPLYDYINASLDTNCITGTSETCQNYNYMSLFDKSWWTMTATDENSYKAYKIESSGYPRLNQTAIEVYVRPVIVLTNDSIYVKGNGTIENPYIIK